MCDTDVINHQKALLKRVYNELHKEFSDEYILACYGEINKERRFIAIGEAKKHHGTTILELPTDKQLKFARDLGIDPTNLSKQELSKKIDEKRGKQ